MQEELTNLIAYLSRLSVRPYTDTREDGREETMTSRAIVLAAFVIASAVGQVRYEDISRDQTKTG